MRHTQKTMSNGGEHLIVLGPPSGEDWDFSPRAADAIADARVTVLTEQGQSSSGSDKDGDSGEGTG